LFNEFSLEILEVLTYEIDEVIITKKNQVMIKAILLESQDESTAKIIKVFKNEIFLDVLIIIDYG
jgi:hypothetical protein